MKIIKLTESHRGGGKSTSFSGRPEGEKVREQLNIDALDEDTETYCVDIPIDTTSFNSSFFLGLFFDSVVHLQSIEKFREKYLFQFDGIEDDEVRAILLEDIDDGFRRASNELNGKTGLDC